ncbi:MAG: hypothetical protein NUV83_02625 [Candidatus Wolfebacteria bacterium]|nr:hypothetical protein [Candidatus Wolfebacteria bacterium]
MNIYRKMMVVVFATLSLFLFKGPVFADQIDQNPSSTTSTTAVVSALESKKESLTDALTASYDELNELKSEVESIKVNDPWDKIKTNLLNQTDKIKDYYNNSSEKLGSENIDQDSIKSLAKELKYFREGVFSEYYKNSINFILIFEEANLLKIADSRLDKISSDLARLEKQSVSKTKTLKTLYNDADKHLKLAHDLNDSAKTLFYNYLNPVKPDETKPEETNQKKEDQISDPQALIRNISHKSLDELKATYDIFINMSKTL